MQTNLYYFGNSNPTLIGNAVRIIREDTDRVIVKIKNVTKHVKKESLVELASKPSKWQVRKAKLKTGHYPIKK